jgi:hypothetical protein
MNGASFETTIGYYCPVTFVKPRLLIDLQGFPKALLDEPKASPWGREMKGLQGVARSIPRAAFTGGKRGAPYFVPQSGTTKSSFRNAKAGGPDQVRTDDLLNAIEALFQLSYEPIATARDQSNSCPV